LRAYKELADTFNEQSQCANALPFYQHVVDRATPALLEIKTNALSGYASCLGDLGRNVEAINIMKLQLAAEIERFGELNSEPLNTRHNLATLLRQRGEFEEAYQQIKLAFEGRARLLGPQQKRTLNSQVSLATVLRLLNRQAEALPLARDALEKFRATLGANAPETRTACDGLANIELSANQRDAALRTWQTCLAEANAFGVWENAETIKMRNNYGGAWCARPEDAAQPASEQRSAAQHLRSTLAAGMQLWGADNFQTARIEANLGMCLAAIGAANPGDTSENYLKESKQYLNHAIEALTPVVGPDDAQLARAKAALQMLLN
jgi:Tetratricopeptide repeat